MARAGAARVPSAVPGAAIWRSALLSAGREKASYGISSGSPALPKLGVVGSNPVLRSMAFSGICYLRSVNTWNDP